MSPSCKRSADMTGSRVPERKEQTRVTHRRGDNQHRGLSWTHLSPPPQTWQRTYRTGSLHMLLHHQVMQSLRGSPGELITSWQSTRRWSRIRTLVAKLKHKYGSRGGEVLTRQFIGAGFPPDIYIGTISRYHARGAAWKVPLRTHVRTR